MQRVIIEQDGRIATIRINNPPLNILTTEVREGLFSALDKLEGTPAVHVVIVEAAGERAFSVGSDITEFPEDEIAGVGKIRFEQHLLNRLANLPHVTIAKVGAMTLGGGGEVVLACDLRIAAAGAQIGFPEIRLGALPAAGGMKRLVQDIGPARARQLVLLGKPIAAEQALAFGLINEVVPASDLDSRVKELALELSALPPDALALAKKRISAALPQTDADTVEAESFGRLFRGSNLREGVAAFLQKRRPSFAGRGPGQEQDL